LVLRFGFCLLSRFAPMVLRLLRRRGLCFVCRAKRTMFILASLFCHSVLGLRSRFGRFGFDLRDGGVVLRDHVRKNLSLCFGAGALFPTTSTMRDRARFRPLVLAVLVLGGVTLGLACGDTIVEPLVFADAGLDGDDHECLPPLLRCSGDCVEVATSNDHCGECGKKCIGGQSCHNGDCECEAMLSFCDSECVDLENDPKHCGGCDGKCQDSEDCSGGHCM